MKSGRPLRWTVLAVLILSCRSVPPAPQRSVPSVPPARRVVLLSLDGAGAGVLHQLYREGALPAGGFARFFQDGEVADRLIPVEPALTSTNHISLATGYAADRTGIVGNNFHVAGTPWLDTVSGFAAPIGTETLWEAARPQGKRGGGPTRPGAGGKASGPASSPGRERTTRARAAGATGGWSTSMIRTASRLWRRWSAAPGSRPPRPGGPGSSRAARPFRRPWSRWARGPERRASISGRWTARPTARPTT